jgi:hypothetical protein
MDVRDDVTKLPVASSPTQACSCGPAPRRCRASATFLRLSGVIHRHRTCPRHPGFGGQCHSWLYAARFWYVIKGWDCGMLTPWRSETWCRPRRPQPPTAAFGSEREHFASVPCIFHSSFGGRIRRSGSRGCGDAIARGGLCTRRAQSGMSDGYPGTNGGIVFYLHVNLYNNMNADNITYPVKQFTPIGRGICRNGSRSLTAYIYIYIYIYIDI